MKRSFFLLILIFLTASKSFSQTWVANPAHSRMGFSVTNFLIADVQGSFKKFSSSFTSSKEDFTDASIEVIVDINSIETGIKKRDRHLKSEDYFDVEKYPQIVFKSKYLKKVGDKKYLLNGTLTFHGVTKPVELEATLIHLTLHPSAVAEFEVKGNLKRSDFDLGKGTLAAAMSDDVEISIKVEYVKQQ